MKFLFAILAALSYTFGGVFMKHASYLEGVVNLYPTIIAYLCFATGVTFQLTIMRDAELGVTYILVLGLESLLAVFLGYLFFKETLSLIKVFAVMLIVLGISLINVEFSK